MIYLASPYSDPDPRVRIMRFEAVCMAAASLMRQGMMVFSPIAHTHPIAEYGLPKGWKFWKEYDRQHIAMADSIVVLMLPGWKDSVGVHAEIELANAAGKLVQYMEPETLVIQDEP